MKYFVKTFGCQMNLSDSERIDSVMNNSGFEKSETPDETDLIIFNTCSVRQKGEDRVFGFLKEYKKRNRKNPKFRMGITGCMARKTGVSKLFSKEFNSKDPLFSRSPLLDFVFRIEDVQDLPKYISVLYDEDFGKDYESEQILEELASKKEDRLSYMEVTPKLTKKYQAFVPIQTGCNKYCYYCIVPFTRKAEQSREANLIVNEVEKLVQNGCKEVTLLGQTVDSYNPDKITPKDFKKLNKTPFVELLERLNEIDGLDRIRFTSPHPTDMTDELINAHARLEKLCPYIHLPVQSGSNKILEAMNRPYTREHYFDLVKKIKEAVPDCAISTDIIVGFPGETEEDFEDTYDLFEKVGFDFSFTARYSPRKGTFAERKLPDDVTPEEKARRWHKLNDLLKEISKKKYSELVGSEQEILVEKTKGTQIEGKARNFKTILIDKKTIPEDVEINEGDLLKVKVIDSDMWYGKGELV